MQLKDTQNSFELPLLFELSNIFILYKNSTWLFDIRVHHKTVRISLISFKNTSGRKIRLANDVIYMYIGINNRVMNKHLVLVFLLHFFPTSFLRN